MSPATHSKQVAMARAVVCSSIRVKNSEYEIILRSLVSGTFGPKREELIGELERLLN